MGHNITKFYFYKSYYDAISQLSDESRLTMYDSVLKYVFESKEPDNLDGILKGLFILLKNIIHEDIMLFTD